MIEITIFDPYNKNKYYQISYSENQINVWFKNEEGEGMETTHEKLMNTIFPVLDDFFQKNY